MIHQEALKAAILAVKEWDSNYKCVNHWFCKEYNRDSFDPYASLLGTDTTYG